MSEPIPPLSPPLVMALRLQLVRAIYSSFPNGNGGSWIYLNGEERVTRAVEELTKLGLMRTNAVPYTIESGDPKVMRATAWITNEGREYLNKLNSAGEG